MVASGPGPGSWHSKYADSTSEAKEPPIYRVLDVICHNEVAKALGKEKYRVKVTRLQRAVQEYLRHQGRSIRSRVLLTTEQLRALIADRESDRVELTVSTNNTDKFGEAICAFANDFSNHRQPGISSSAWTMTGRSAV